MSQKQTPSDFLKQIIGRPVVVKLNNGVDYRGKQLSVACARKPAENSSIHKLQFSYLLSDRLWLPNFHKKCRF